MSIEISGPKGYEVQYLVTVWGALLAERASPAQASVLIEHKEDAEITVTLSGIQRRIALQSKYQAGKLDLGDLAAWLAHFPPHSDSESLFERILPDENQLALFVTQARCGDEARGFCRPRGRLESARSSAGNNQASERACAKIWRNKTAEQLHVREEASRKQRKIGRDIEDGCRSEIAWPNCDLGANH